MQEILDRLCESLLRRRLSILSNAPNTPSHWERKAAEIMMLRGADESLGERVSGVLLLWLCVLSGKPGCVQGRRNELLPPKRWYNMETTNFFTALAHALIVFLSVAAAFVSRRWWNERKLKCFTASAFLFVGLREIRIWSMYEECARKWHTLLIWHNAYKNKLGTTQRQMAPIPHQMAHYYLRFYI